MPIYEYACMKCEKVVSRFVRNVAKDKPSCPECAGTDIHRVMSNFAMHLSLLTKVDQLDPKYDKMIDASSPDLAFENLVKKYRLDQPVPKLEKGQIPGTSQG